MHKGEEIMPRLVRKYLELSALCYRAATASHDQRGRFQRGRSGGRSHPAVIKKIDLDEALDRIYQRFFGGYDPSEVSSTSKSRCQGRETLSPVASSCGAAPIT